MQELSDIFLRDETKKKQIIHNNDGSESVFYPYKFHNATCYVSFLEPPKLAPSLFPEKELAELKARSKREEQRAEKFSYFLCTISGMIVQFYSSIRSAFR